MTLRVNGREYFHSKNEFCNIEGVNLVDKTFKSYMSQIDGLREEISLRIISYITKIPSESLKSSKIKLKSLKTKVTIESQRTTYGNIERWVYNGEVLAEMIPSIEKITYSIKPSVYWEKSK